MATQPEARIVAQIMSVLGSLPRCWAFKVHGGMYQSAGVPDIVGVHDGRFFAIEVKTATGKATKLQELVLRRIIKAGGRAGVARGVEEALAIINSEDQ